MSEYVLDASAVLALLFQEPGKERVVDILDQSIMSRINVTEVLTKVLEKGTSLTEAIENFEDLNLSIIEFDDPQSRRTVCQVELIR